MQRKSFELETLTKALGDRPAWLIPAQEAVSVGFVIDLTVMSILHRLLVLLHVQRISARMCCASVRLSTSSHYFHLSFIIFHGGQAE